MVPAAAAQTDTDCNSARPGTAIPRDRNVPLTPAATGPTWVSLDLRSDETALIDIVGLDQTQAVVADEGLSLAICNDRGALVFPASRRFDGVFDGVFGDSDSSGIDLPDGKRFTFRPATTGRYRAAMRNTEQFARYEVLVRSRTAATATGETSVNLAVAEGKVIGDDLDLADGNSKIYLFAGTAGQVATISLKNDGDFSDPFLSLAGRPAGSPWTKLTENDDSEVSLDSFIEYELPYDGEYAIEARTSLSGGKLKLSVALGPPVPLATTDLPVSTVAREVALSRPAAANRLGDAVLRLAPGSSGKHTLTVESPVPVVVELGMLSPLDVIGRSQYVKLREIGHVDNKAQAFLLPLPAASANPPVAYLVRIAQEDTFGSAVFVADAAEGPSAEAASAADDAAMGAGPDPAPNAPSQAPTVIKVTLTRG